MGKKVYFLDSIKKSDGSYDNTYGVDDVNAIVSNLVGAGIAPFPSGDTYDVSELNSLTSALVAEGTSFDGLKVSFADNKIHIAQGIGYFENGATIVVDSDGEELDYNVAEILYVYAEYNQALNTCGFYASENEPSDDIGIYTLMLATIAADGTVTDKRVVAQSKVASLGKNEIIELYKPETAQTFGNGATICEVSVPNLGKYNMLWIIWRYMQTPHYHIRAIPTDEISNYNDSTLYVGGDGGRLSLNLTGNVLKFYNLMPHDHYSYPLTFYPGDDIGNPPEDGTIFFLA